MPPDNWIYIQEPDVKIGRLQIFNNWSPALVADPDTIWLGLEYFCREGDDLWSMKDGRFIEFAAGELAKIGLIERRDVLDGTVVRVPKAYPAYFGEYRRLRHGPRLTWTSSAISIRSGATACIATTTRITRCWRPNGAVDSIINGGQGKSEIWDINAEESYHEEDAPALILEAQSRPDKICHSVTLARHNRLRAATVLCQRAVDTMSIITCIFNALRLTTGRLAQHLLHPGYRRRPLLELEIFVFKSGATNV